MVPNDGFKKFSASILIGKSFSKLLDVHDISSCFWRRYYHTELSDEDKVLPFFGYSSVIFNDGTLDTYTNAIPILRDVGFSAILILVCAYVGR